MTAAEHDQLMSLAAKVREQSGNDELAVQVLTAGGIHSAFAADKVHRLGREKDIPSRSPFAELLARPLPARSEGRCLVLAPARDEHKEELSFLREQVVAPAFETLPYEVSWIAGVGEAAVIEAARLIVIMMPTCDPETIYGLGFANAYDKPVVTIAAQRTELPERAGRQDVLRYNWSTSNGLSASSRDDLTRALRATAVRLSNEPVERAKPLRQYCSNAALTGLLDAKRRSLRKFYLAMLTVREELEADYEFQSEGGNRVEALSAIGELMRQPAEIFRAEFTSLHEAAKALETDLPAVSVTGCLALCGAMKQLADDACAWVEILQQAPASFDEAREQLSALFHRAIDCRNLLQE